MRNRLEKRWGALWERMGAHGDPLPVFRDLVARYSEPHRKYHTLAHIKHCLEEFEEIRHLAKNPNAVELALWLHDLFYDTKRTDNELQSALFAMGEVCWGASLSDDFARIVGGLISSSKDHTISADPDTRIFFDIDLAILGQPSKKFDEYERQIRKEYSWVTHRTFRARRRELLLSFLKRPRIYLTPHFYALYELQAQRNLARSIRNLSR